MRSYQPERKPCDSTGIGMVHGACGMFHVTWLHGYVALDKNNMSSGIAEPCVCAMKTEGKNRRGEGTTPATTACPEAGK